jgi:hypothetical protein
MPPRIWVLNKPKQYTMYKIIIFLTTVAVCLFGCKNDPYISTICPDGYTGENCDLERIPASVIITQLTIATYPTTAPGGATWDIISGPDVYFIIRNATTGQTVYQHAETYQDATGGPLTFSGLNISLPAPAADEYKIEVWDRDTTAPPDDYMGSLQGFVYVPGRGFPSSLETIGETVGFLLSVSYKY